MAKVEIYTSPLCGFCYAAKQLLRQKNIEFTEYDVLLNRAHKSEMLERSQGRTTVPQIFIDAVGIGGFDELSALDDQNKLDSLLQ